MKVSDEQKRLRTWLEIDTKAVAHNYRVFRTLIGKKTKLLGVIKSNAYGHNLLEFGGVLEKLGIDWLGVDSLVEALSVRREKVMLPILVLGYTLPNMYDEARKQGISVTVSNFAALKAAMKLTHEKKPLHIHVKIDTGMHRQGFQLGEEALLLEVLANKKANILVEGMYTHFSEAKDLRNRDFTNRQIKEFGLWVKAFHEAGFDPIIHAGATSGTLAYPTGHFDMVRVGIGLYGIWPSGAIERGLAHRLSLKPVLSWRGVVSEVKSVPKGERIGYDRTELLMRNSRVAVIPIGYWHGFPRLLSSKGRVLIHGQSARVLGRVSMDMIVVDVTDIAGVIEGDIATIIGKDKKQEIHAKELAEMSLTTAYEIVTRLNPLMKRFYI